MGRSTQHRICGYDYFMDRPTKGIRLKKKKFLKIFYPKSSLELYPKSYPPAKVTFFHRTYRLKA